MLINQIIKKQIIIFSLIIVIALASIASVSYAIFYTVTSNTDNQVIQTGNLDVTFGAGGSTISGEILPMTDAQGLAQTGYGITLANQISSPIKYSVTIYNNAPNNFSGTIVSHEYIKISIDGNTPIKLNQLPNQNGGVTENTTIYDLYSDALAVSGSTNHTVRVWLDDNTPYSEAGKYVYLQIKVTSEMADKNFSEYIKAKNSIIATAPTLTNTSSSTNQNGLYEVTATNSGNATYVFRGNVNNNYVTFAGLSWRIVRINEDNSVRIVLANGINSNTLYRFSSSASSANNMVYNNASAEINSVVTSWYNTTLFGYTSKLSEQEYCVGIKASISGASTGTIYSSYSPNFTCSGSDVMSSKIALLTYDDIIYAGSYYNLSNTSYLNATNPTWTMSPAGFVSNVAYDWILSANGSISYTATNSSVNTIRPVINLKANTFAHGEGTSTNPYIIE